MFLKGALAGTAVPNVLSHLASCQSCRARSSVLEERQATPGGSPSETADHDERRRDVRKKTDEAASIRVLSSFVPEEVNVRVLDISRNGLKIYSPQFLTRGTILQIRLRKMLILGEVCYCVTAGDGFKAGLYIKDCVERRESQRLHVNIPATIFTVPKKAKPQQEYSAVIADQSRSGMLLKVGHRISTGNAVRIVCGTNLILAHVIRCRAAGDIFEIGVKVDQTVTL